MNLRTRRISASAAANALHGLAGGDRGDTVAEDRLRGVYPGDADAACAILRRAVAEGTTSSYTDRIFCPAGSLAEGPRWISARGKVVSSGSDRRLLCTLINITDQSTGRGLVARTRAAAPGAGGR